MSIFNMQSPYKSLRKKAWKKGAKGINADD